MPIATGLIRWTLQLTKNVWGFMELKAEPIDVEGFKWTAQFDQYPGVDQLTMKCLPIEENPTSFWNIEAKGHVIAIHGTRKKNLFLWNGVFSNFHDTLMQVCLSRVIFADFLPPQSTETTAYIELRINYHECTFIDISSPINELIRNPSDGILLSVDSKEIYVSNKALSIASPFFDVFFNGEFKEKVEGKYVLSDVEFGTFKRMLAVIHDLKVDINDSSVEDLLEIADRFQCRFVVKRCDDYLRSKQAREFDFKKKILLASHFELFELLAETIRTAPIDELKDFAVFEGGMELSEDARDWMLERIAFG
ncbi:hypothetical protein L596_022470 [Steinernema carpocapsae]|uniref:BTB domain-containing protein n=1 Tax=Steinernema carpocapsae TaxID=34508 RepID=A0A4U5MLT4_STECR|nr:hypothetical protein L596_022470 [Steinernema carpocapsae]